MYNADLDSTREWMTKENPIQVTEVVSGEVCPQCLAPTFLLLIESEDTKLFYEKCPRGDFEKRI